MSDTPIVDPLRDDDWSDGDIRARTETMLANEFDPARIAVLQRQLLGQMTGLGPALTQAEQGLLAAYGQRATELGALGDAARADMAVLREAWAVEAAHRRLAQPILDPTWEEGNAEPSNGAELDADYAARQAAQATIDGASPSALAIVAQRADYAAAQAPAEDPQPAATQEQPAQEEVPA